MTYSMFTSADDHVRISALYAEKGNQGGIYLEDEDEIEDDAGRPMTWERYFHIVLLHAWSKRFLWQREDQAVREWQAQQGLPITHTFRHIEPTLAVELRAIIKDREADGKHVPQIMRDRLHQEENA